MLRSDKERELWMAASGAYGESERLGKKAAPLQLASKGAKQSWTMTPREYTIITSHNFRTYLSQCTVITHTLTSLRMTVELHELIKLSLESAFQLDP